MMTFIMDTLDFQVKVWGVRYKSDINLLAAYYKILGAVDMDSISEEECVEWKSKQG